MGPPLCQPEAQRTELNLTPPQSERRMFMGFVDEKDGVNYPQEEEAREATFYIKLPSVV